MKKGNAYKQTKETIKIILGAIADGLTQRDAATLAGISEDTLSIWKRENSDLSEQMRKKEIEHKLKLIQIIEHAAGRSWQAAAWRLERKYREEFSSNKSLQDDAYRAEENRKIDELASILKTIALQK